MKSTILALSIALGPVLAAASTSSTPYCLALRGNGESQPAHWGALANLIEKKGLPTMQAGGSSASISLFLLENIAANTLVANQSPDIQKSRASLILKSLMGISLYIQNQPQVQEGLDLLKNYKAAAALSEKGRLEFLKELAAGLTEKQVSEKSSRIQQLINDLYNLGVANSPRYSNTLMALLQKAQTQNLTPQELAQMKFYSEEILQAFKTMGDFDAEGDASLFFRDGVVNFDQFGQGIGKIATFLAGSASNSETSKAFEQFITACESKHQGLTWPELLQQQPVCQQLLQDSLKSFFSQKIDWKKANVVFKKVGSTIASLPTTAVLTGSAYEEAQTAYDQYHQNLDRSVALNFRISDTSKIRFGYWGNPGTLAKIKMNLKPSTMGDQKNDRFLALGNVQWHEVLRLSPAEPGLASLQVMQAEGQVAMSAGGWSDLHPVPVLKAAGCEEVVYVTRQGGESLFGQGIAKRLLSLDRSWDFLRTKGEEKVRNVQINNEGDANDMSSLWSRLYNVANPNSSYMQSVQAADFVLCTDWNRLDVMTKLNELVTESYRAPLIVRGQDAPVGCR